MMIFEKKNIKKKQKHTRKKKFDFSPQIIKNHMKKKKK